MKRTKLILSAIFMSGLLSLTACGLFNDDDLSFTNTYNPAISAPTTNPDAVVVEGVEATEVAAVSDAYCFKNIAYGVNDLVTNTYKVGGINHTKFNVNDGKDYPSTTSGNNYDLYVPKGLVKSEKHTVILFIHGGAWVSGFKTDVNPYVYDFANRGYITATIKYSLLKKSMDDTSLSIFRNLDEIDACITSIKKVIGELGFDTTKSNLVIGGVSSGAHLSMLYTYSRGDKSPIPLKFVVNAVGPTDIKPYAWKQFKNASDEVLSAGITYSAIQTQIANENINKLPIAGEGVDWNDYQTLRIANGMCGLPYTTEEIRECTDEDQKEVVYPNEASNAMLEVGGGEDLLSVTNYMSATRNTPMICAYGGRDTIVGIAQFANIQHAMDSYGIDYEYYYFKECDHTDIDEAHDKTTYDSFIGKIAEWCAAI